MRSSLSWIEWFDRLNRVLTDSQRDVAAVAGGHNPRAVVAVEQSSRQLAYLLTTLQLLDPTVLASDAHALRKSLDNAIFLLGSAAELPAAPAATRERMFAAISAGLRDVAEEAAEASRPRRRRA